MSRVFHIHCKVAVLVAAAIVFVVLYYFFDPASVSFSPGCLFRRVTGWRCPGCGAQRAVHALLHGDLASAFRFNALFVCVSPLVVFIIFSDVFRKRFPHLFLVMGHRCVWMVLLVVSIVWWVLRNVYWW